MDDDLRKLYARADEQNILIRHCALVQNVAVSTRYAGNDYIVMDYRRLRRTRHHKTVLAHELGHLATGSLYSRAVPYETLGRCEARATRWAIETLLPFERLRDAMHDGYTETWELADFFNVDESLVRAACLYYTEARGFNFNE